MTTIEWTHVPDGKGGRKKGETWNPQVGCSEVSPGCRNCYAARFAGRGTSAQHRGLTIKRSNGVHWNGELRRVPELLEKPLRWREPRGVFVGSMTDIFHEDAVATEEGRRFIAAIFGVMAACPQHTFMLLTKRPAKMREWFEWLIRGGRGWSELAALIDEMAMSGEAPSALLNTTRQPWPLPNVWIGTTVEDQRRADERIPELLRVPAAVRFLSCEPLLGPVNLDKPMPANWSALPGRGAWDWASSLTGRGWDAQSGEWSDAQEFERISWLIIGGESGPGARPMHPDWARSLVRQGNDAGVPAFFKQWGEHAPWLNEEWFTHGGEEKHAHTWVARTGEVGACWISDDDGEWSNWTGDPPTSPNDPGLTDVAVMSRIGKGKAGRILDGRTWDEFPEVDR